MDAGRPTDPPPMADSREVEGRAAAWLARRDGAGDAWSDADAAALEAWLASAAAHRVAFLRLESAWEQAGRLQALAAGMAPGVPERGRWTGQSPGALLAGAPLVPRVTAPTDTTPTAGLASLVFTKPARPGRPRRRAPRRAAWRGYAALSASVLLAASLAWGWQLQGAVDTASHGTEMGRVQSVPLADGSRTVLSSDTRIEVHLSRGERRIDLQQGEAFFEAARDARRPFVVHAGERRVTAVGTRFSVRREGRDLRVVVTEGTVRLESGTHDGLGRPAALLPAGSVALATASGVVVRSGTVEAAERLVDWQDGFLAFQDTTLADAAAEFNRYNARRIVIGDDATGALRIGGSFRWSNAEGFVRLLEQGFPVRAEYLDDRIVLHQQ